MKGLSIQRRALFGLLKALNLPPGTCVPSCPFPFAAAPLSSSPFSLRATPPPPFLAALSLSHPRPGQKLFSSVCDPLRPLLHAWLLAGAGAGAAYTAGGFRAPRRLPPLGCLAMDEKQRQICLWFKVHPSNYSD